MHLAILLLITTSVAAFPRTKRETTNEEAPSEPALDFTTELREEIDEETVEAQTEAPSEPSSTVTSEQENVICTPLKCYPRYPGVVPGYPYGPYGGAPYGPFMPGGFGGPFVQPLGPFGVGGYGGFFG